MKYKFKVEGMAAAGQSWTASGVVAAASPGQFQLVIDGAMRETFAQLTGGKAIYGKPGIGCRGPYTITSFLLTVEEET